MKYKRFRFIPIFVLLLSLVGETLYAIPPVKKRNKTTPKTSAEARRKQEETKKEIKLTEQQIRDNELEVKRNLSELGKIEGDILLIQKNITQINSRLSKLSQEIESLESNISDNEKEISRLRDEYLKAVKRMRVSKKTKSDLAFIFSSDNFNQALRRMRYLREFSSWREKQTEEINSRLSVLKEEKERLAKAREEEKEALSLQQINETKLVAQRRQQEEVVDRLKKNGAALKTHLQKKQEEANELGGIISQLIAAEENQRREEERKRQEAKRQEEERKRQEEERRLAAEKKKENSGSKREEYASARKRVPRSDSGKETAKAQSGTGFDSMKGKLPKPTNGYFTVTSRFGRQSLPELPDVVYENPGIDAESSAGSSAVAVYKGTVSGVYLLPGYNTVVIISHDGYYTVYGNISNSTVKVGDNVQAGQNLGSLALAEDNPGHSTLHFEVWKNRQKLDPLEWLR